MAYNWQQKDWPHFRYDLADIMDKLFAFAEETGHTTGILKTLPENTRLETMIDTMIMEALKTSEIAGNI